MDNFDLRKYLAENKITSNSKAISEQADHVAPMVVKAYKEYLEAKKEGNGEKAYRYYSKKLNNTYSTRADRDAIEAILKKKYGSALEEASKEEMDKFAKFQKDLQKTMSTQGWKDLEDRAKEERKEREARKSKPVKEIKGFEEFKETGFKLGDKVKFMGSAHPTHIKPIKLTGTIEYFEPADEIGVRVDGYGKFIPFFEIPSSIELTEGGQLNEGLFMDVQDFNKEEYPHIHSWDETIDYNDMLSFAKDYAKYVATLAAQEFMDTDIPKEAIDEFLSKFNI